MRSLVVMCVLLSACNGKAELIHGFSYERVHVNECLATMERAMRELDKTLTPHDDYAVAWTTTITRPQWELWHHATRTCWTLKEKEHTP